jgi:hypothetical protein
MAADVFALTIVASVANQFVENVLHFQSNMSSSSTPGPDAQVLVAGFQADTEPQWLATLSDDYLLQGYRCKRVNNGGGPTVILPRTGVPGTIGDDSVTSGQGAVLISPYEFIPTFGSNKWRVGRIFLPAIPQTQIIENELQPAYLTQLNLLCGGLGDSIGTGPNFIYGVYTRLGTSTVPFYEPATIYPSSHIGTQRRRLRPVL